MKTTRNLIARRPTDKILLRIPVELTERLDEEARLAGRSRNTEMVARLAQSVGLLVDEQARLINI